MKKRSEARQRRRLDPSLNVRGEVPYLAVSVPTARGTWSDANALFGQVFDALGRQGLPPAGPPFYRHGASDDDARVQAGIPIGEARAGEGRLVAGVLPAGAYATAVHLGHPDGLAAAHEELRAWVEEQGLRIATRRVEGEEVHEARIESFLTDPSKGANPERWSIEIAYLLAPPGDVADRG